MTSIFMIIVIIIGLLTIFLEVKNKERSDKIFYTFYLFVVSVIILPFMGIFGSLIAYLIFTALYSILLYSIYTDFEIFTQISEALLVYKKVSKKQILKIDYEFVELVKKYYESLIKEYTIQTYYKCLAYIDLILIIIGIILTIILLFTI